MRWLGVLLLAAFTVLGAPSSAQEVTYEVVLRVPERPAPAISCGTSVFIETVWATVDHASTPRLRSGDGFSLDIVNCAGIDAGCYRVDLSDLEVRAAARGARLPVAGLTPRASAYSLAPAACSAP